MLFSKSGLAEIARAHQGENADGHEGTRRTTMTMPRRRLGLVFGNSLSHNGVHEGQGRISIGDERRSLVEWLNIAITIDDMELARFRRSTTDFAIRVATEV